MMLIAGESSTLGVIFEWSIVGCKAWDDSSWDECW